MVDPNFFESVASLSLQDLVGTLKAKGVSDLYFDKDKAEKSISGVATLKRAQGSELSFFHNIAYKNDLAETHSGVVITSEKHKNLVPDTSVALITSTPYRAYALAAQILFPTHDQFVHPQTEPHHPEARVDLSVVCETNVVVKAYADIGAGTRIGANTVIGRSVKVGRNCFIGQNVTLSHCIIGDNVTILPGTCIGQSGFGFHMDEKGAVTVPQLGRVVIEDHVEIGANVTIDRGALDDTFIGAGTRIDNLVQLGHGVRLGRGCVIVSQVGIAGSTEFGNYVVAAGQAGFGGHIKVGDGAHIAAKSGVMRDVEPGARIGGNPAIPIRLWHRQSIVLANLISKRSSRTPVDIPDKNKA